MATLHVKRSYRLGRYTVYGSVNLQLVKTGISLPDAINLGISQLGNKSSQYAMLSISDQYDVTQVFFSRTGASGIGQLGIDYRKPDASSQLYIGQSGIS